MAGEGKKKKVKEWLGEVAGAGEVWGESQSQAPGYLLWPDPQRLESGVRGQGGGGRKTRREQ